MDCEIDLVGFIISGFALWIIVFVSAILETKGGKNGKERKRYRRDD